MRTTTIVWQCSIFLALGGLWCGAASAQPTSPAGGFNGLGMNLGNLARLSNAQTRSISPENFTGEKGKAGMATEGTGAGAARDLGRGWKMSPSVHIEPGKTFDAGRHRRARARSSRSG